jgi:DNA-directed RNA polymerase subunit K/omega
MPNKSKLDQEIEDVTNIVDKSIDDPEAGGIDSDQDDDLAGSETDDASSTNESKSQNDDDEDDEDELDDANTDDDEGGDDDEDGLKEKNDEDEDINPKTVKQLRVAKKRALSKKNIEDDLTLLGVPHGLNFDDDEDEDESDEDHDDDEYFQKLKSDVRQNFAEIYHPESFSHNYDEIQTLSKVIRNSFGVIIDDLHRTIPFMTKYEKTRILGQRAKQLNEGAPPLIKIDTTVIDGYLIAVKELEQKKTPFIIRRPLPNGGSEYWRVQDLEIL